MERKRETKGKCRESYIATDALPMEGEMEGKVGR